MSNTKFLCGRLFVYKDGSTKKVELSDGGGARECTINHIDMGFEEIHDRLREIFQQDANCTSKLYDFERKVLDTSRYTTFYEYIQKRCLRLKGILLYLGIPADGEDAVTFRSPEKARTPIQRVQNPSSVVRIPQVEADSSTPPVIIKPENDLPAINQTRRMANLPRSSSSTYSFERALNDLVDHLRNLIYRNRHESILIPLFEHICTIRGLGLIILDQLKRQLPSVNEHQASIYNDGLERIEKISRSINALIELNRMRISQIDHHSLIVNSFNQFHQNFNILHEQWTRSHNSSRQSTNYIVAPAPPTSRKRTRTPSRSYRRSNEEEEEDERYSLFKSLFKSLENLLDVLHQRRFISFSNAVESLVGELKRCRSTIKLTDELSLYSAERLIISIEDRLTNRINDEDRRAHPHGLHPQLGYTFDKTLDSISHLLKSFDHYRTKIEKHKRSRPTTNHQSSSKEKKPPVHHSTEPKPRNNHHDDDQSSEASHSSFGDEVLMELARGSYEQNPNRLK